MVKLIDMGSRKVADGHREKMNGVRSFCFVKKERALEIHPQIM